MKEFRFLDWDVYKDAKQIVKETFSLTKKFSHYDQNSIGLQMNRSALSIVLNIAEGSGKNSDRELGRFFNISIGSAYETIAALDVAFDIGLISEMERNQGIAACKNIVRQLVNFKKKLSK